MKKTYLILFISLASILSAFYFEYYMKLYPCNLCLAQRFSHYLIIGTSLLTILCYTLKTKWLVFLGKCAMLLSIISGIIVSTRQVYLQRFADHSNLNCGIDLVTMFENFAPTIALKKLFEGTLNCSVIDWSLFGISIADYSLILFITMLVIQLFNFKSYK